MLGFRLICTRTKLKQYSMGKVLLNDCHYPAAFVVILFLPK